MLRISRAVATIQRGMREASESRDAAIIASLLIEPNEQSGQGQSECTDRYLLDSLITSPHLCDGVR